MNVNQGIGDWIRSQREIVGLSQAELAKKIGVSTALIGFWETGRNNPREDRVVVLEKIFGRAREHDQRSLSSEAATDQMIQFKGAATPAEVGRCMYSGPPKEEGYFSGRTRRKPICFAIPGIAMGARSGNTLG